MATNVDITPNKNESSTSLLRRFSRLFRDTGVNYGVRSRRYFKRDASTLRKKNTKLRRIDDSKRYTKLRKLGKM